MTWGRRENLEIIDEQDLEQLPWEKGAKTRENGTMPPLTIN